MRCKPQATIALDARWIFPEITGIGAYTRELIRNLAELEDEHRYLLLFSSAALRDRTLAETGAAAPRFAPLLLPYGVFSPRGQILLPPLLRRRGVDVYHATNYLVPLAAFPRGRRGRTACVATVHDVIPLLFPDAAPRSRKSRLFPLYRRLMIEVGRRADALITDSRAGAEDVARELRLTPAARRRLHAVPCGVSERFRAPPHARQPPESRGRQPGKQLLYVGRSDPYKNLCGLMHVLARLRARLSEPVRLVIVGPPDPRYPEPRALARELGLADNVRWTGYVPEHELVALYRNSDLLIHPSRYEGFGLQILEAMAGGLPVVCSNAASLPEVAGDAAILLEPDDLDGFATAAERVLTEPALARELSRRGLVRSARFTWRATAEITRGIYESVAE